MRVFSALLATTAAAITATGTGSLCDPKGYEEPDSMEENDAIKTAGLALFEAADVSYEITI